MKLQFSIASLLLAAAAIAITCGGIQAYRAGYDEDAPDFWAWYMTSPPWVPAVFAAYAAYRRSLTVRMVLVFALAEATAVILNYTLRLRHLT